MNVKIKLIQKIKFENKKLEREIDIIKREMSDEKRILFEKYSKKFEL